VDVVLSLYVLMVEGFLSMYYCQLLPHSDECNPIQSCSDFHLVVVYFSYQSHGRGSFSLSWHQSISRMVSGVAITLIYMLYGCGVI
jgi:hypothetical protein